MLADTQVQICRQYARTPAAKNFKLAPNLMAKKYSVTYYSNQNSTWIIGDAQQFHRVIVFAHHPWMEPSICLNTRMLAAAKTDMEKECNKLMYKALYRKTCANQRKRSDFEASQ